MLWIYEPTSLSCNSIFQTSLLLAAEFFSLHLHPVVRRKRRRSEPIYQKQYEVTGVTPDHINVDYINKNVYFAEQGNENQGIFIMDIFNKIYTKKIVRSYRRITGLAINPEKGYTFFLQLQFVLKLLLMNVEKYTIFWNLYFHYELSYKGPFSY